VRIDRIKTSLESPYEGPYPVSERITDRIFKIIVNGEAVNISVDRLKPAFIEAIPDKQQLSRTHFVKYRNLSAKITLINIRIIPTK